MRCDYLHITVGALSLALISCSEAPTPPTAATRHALASAARETDPDDAHLDVPLAGLTPEQLDRFNRGRLVFARVFDARSGLGPSFNSAACANCHEGPSIGGFGDDLDEDVETHVSVVTEDGCSDLAAFGGAVIQHHTTDLFQQTYPGYAAEEIPAEAQGHIAHRTTPALFGFGLLEAIPASTIIALADRNAASGGPVKGRANVVNGQLLRFGRKATDATLLGFNAGAFQNEMGITTNLASAEQMLTEVPYPFDIKLDPIVGAELSDDDLALATDFVRFLSPPPQAKGGSTSDGRELFSSIGCASCHVPMLRTGPSPIAALNNVKVEAFTDLLLHDMGPGLADICRGTAGPSEFRTEPLMGLRFREHFLHDARSTTLEDAIAKHGGEAAASRDRFAGLAPNQRAALIAYLNTL